MMAKDLHGGRPACSLTGPPHTIIVERIEHSDNYEFVLSGEYRIQFEHLFPDITPPEKAMYDGLMAWREHKAKNAARFAEIDAELLAEHQRFADTWPS